MLQLPLIRIVSYAKTENNSTHNVPPATPVNSYHCTILGTDAKPFPNASQGQLISPSAIKCSSASQATIRKRYPGTLPYFFLNQLYNRRIKVRKREYRTIDAIAPLKFAYAIQYVVKIVHKRKTE